MKKFNVSTISKLLLADTLTPVGVYLRLRDKLPNCLLLESSDYHGDEHSLSYICCNPISKFVVADDEISIEYPDGSQDTHEIKEREEAMEKLKAYRDCFECDTSEQKHAVNGLFGYSSYDAVKYFEEVDIDTFETADRKIPDMYYQMFGIVIVFDHFKDQLYIYEHGTANNQSVLKEVEVLLNNKEFAAYSFESDGNESSNLTDEQFMEIVQKGKDHCQRGDVFQIVLSRRFSQSFSGDEFNVYRALRSINPSPYLFYFDYGSFRIMGSSPEAQIVIKEGKATIYPIAGTFRRTGNDKSDYDLATKLFDDPKENSEHVMLVDLARNDLSRQGSGVEVETFKEIQYYSHVIHMVSKVTGKLDDESYSLQLVADTFPAGTLSGAPKHMAMKLINKYENGNRGYYGGAIGFIGFNGDFNHAIMIRTIMSKGNQLYYQAGAGVVAKSEVESEKNEVYNKIAALQTAIREANNIK